MRELSQGLEAVLSYHCLAYSLQWKTTNPLLFFCSKAKCSGSGRMWLE